MVIAYQNPAALTSTAADINAFDASRVLVPKNDPTTLEDIASSCETFERPIFIKDSNHPQGRVDKCFSICSVVCLFPP